MSEPISQNPENWICDYIMYSQYLQNPDKFEYFVNGSEPTGPDSGYGIWLTSNAKGIAAPIMFQLTPASGDSVHLKGGIPEHYIAAHLDATTAVSTLLEY